MRSRWMLVIGAVQRFFRRRNRGELVEIVHEHAHVHVQAHTHAHADGHGHGTVHAHVGRMPDDPFVNYARGTALGVGMLHGIGAETPTQVVIFLTAAGVGGKTTGMLVLASFVVGLLASNTVVAAAATFGLLGASRNFGVYAAVSLVTAVFSLVVGAIFLFGSAAMLPSMLGG
jgi:ABC-type nickel/cobalt efflux system permease component RcnA